MDWAAGGEPSMLVSRMMHTLLLDFGCARGYIDCIARKGNAHKENAWTSMLIEHAPGTGNIRGMSKSYLWPKLSYIGSIIKAITRMG